MKKARFSSEKDGHFYDHPVVPAPPGFNKRAQVSWWDKYGQHIEYLYQRPCAYDTEEGCRGDCEYCIELFKLMNSVKHTGKT